MSTIFSKIIAGEIPAHKVAESNECLAFMDVNPIAPGHVLVIPKAETDYIFDLEDDQYVQLWLFAKTVAQGLKNAFPCEKVGVAVVGLEVAHAHIHLVPLNQVSDLDFSKEKLQITSDELAAAAERIKQAVLAITARTD